MNAVNLILASTEVLSQANKLLADVARPNIMFAAKNIAASPFMSNASPALRERLVSMTSMLLAAVSVMDDNIAAEYGPEEDVATNG